MPGSIITKGFGGGSTIGLVVTRGYVVGDAVVFPTVPSVEFTIGKERLHFTVDGERVHFAVNKDRLMFTPDDEHLDFAITKDRLHFTIKEL